MKETKEQRELRLAERELRLAWDGLAARAYQIGSGPDDGSDGVFPAMFRRALNIGAERYDAAKRRLGKARRAVTRARHP